MTEDATPNRRETFSWRETAARLQEAWSRYELALDEGGRAFVGTSNGNTVRFQPPTVQPIGDAGSPTEYLELLRPELGLQLVVLVQAGATALGLWRDDELLLHKVIKKYVVRGKGRAQPLHLKTRGKSRYGSRLRLQNAKSQLAETNEKMLAWRETHGRPDQILLSCPIRTIADLRQTTPPPPYEAEGPTPIKIPYHVHTPNHDELLRIRRRLSRGALEITSS